MAMVTQAGKATTTADRFKPLSSRCKWFEQAAHTAELGSAAGTEGLQERLRSHEPSKQFVFVLAVQCASGVVCCKHMTSPAATSALPDVGPCRFVMDHGRGA